MAAGHRAQRRTTTAPRQDGVALFQTTTKGGRRFSAADAFLRPVRKRPNLEIATARARRAACVLEGGRAVGVEYEQGGSVKTARAEREVVVSAGAYGSPQLLMLSGIGPADHLREHGIERRAWTRPTSAPTSRSTRWRSSTGAPRGDTLDDAANPRYLLPWLLAGKGKLSSTIAEAAVHWRSDPGLPAPDFQILLGPVYFWEHGFRKTGAPAITLGARLPRPAPAAARCACAPPTRPTTRGSSTTRSPPRARSTRCCARSSFGPRHRGREPFAARLGEELNPSAGITRPRRARRLAARHLRARVPPHAAPAGSAAPEEGVVDPELRVHGVEALRVADASVMPRVPSGNTHAPTVMIAERCRGLRAGPCARAHRGGDGGAPARGAATA